jgi:hypothetical protein
MAYIYPDQTTPAPTEATNTKGSGVFANPVYGTAGLGNNPTQPPSYSQTVEEQKQGKFANPQYGQYNNTATGPSNANSPGLTNAAKQNVYAGGVGATKVNLPTSGITFGGASGGSGSADDWRVRVSVSPSAKVLYNAGTPGVLSPLKATNGVIFPYVPSVTISHAARYNPQTLTHSNYTNYFYEGSEVQAINITADFTVQNVAEASYFLAALYFFRAATKMFYGQSGEYQGSPPPIVYLDGFGQHYLPHVSCIVTSFSHTMPPDVDYVGVAAGPITRVPTSSQFSLSFQPVYSRSSQRKFSFDTFAAGGLLNGAGGGGFL